MERRHDSPIARLHLNGAPNLDLTLSTRTHAKFWRAPRFLKIRSAHRMVNPCRVTLLFSHGIVCEILSSISTIALGPSNIPSSHSFKVTL
jgi:hypothetical protein